MSLPETGSTQRWQTLMEFTHFIHQGMQAQIVEQVLDGVRKQRLSFACQNRLVAAVHDAVSNLLRFHPQGLNLRIIIRRLISEHTLNKLNNGKEIQVHPEAETLDPSEEDSVSPLGWGFFLVEKGNRGLDIGRRDSPHSIELFLYLETEAFDRDFNKGIS